jgi:two-component system, NtrC family, sensor kinase
MVGLMMFGSVGPGLVSVVCNGNTFQTLDSSERARVPGVRGRSLLQPGDESYARRMAEGGCPTGGENMSEEPGERPFRILVVDDNAAIHNDFRKTLGSQPVGRSQLDDLERSLFGETSAPTQRAVFRIDSAFQGQEALAMVEEASKAGDPYTLAFVDVRMPPGWDGIETIEHLWECCPELQVVLCTAYSDYTWDDLAQRLLQTDSLLILKKPFDTTEVLQVAHALTRKWTLARQARLRLEDLDRVVRERTEKLKAEMSDRLRLEGQLRQAQKLEAVGRLAAGVAHEFNNLLTVIQGHADLLGGTEMSAQAAAESVARIAQASQRAASLTRRLLAFSHKQAVQFKPVQLSAAVQGLAKMLGQLIGENYQLCLDCAADLPAARADQNSLEQTLINLVLNARDAMPSGGTIRIATRLAVLDEAAARASLQARPGRFIGLSVADTGCGMSPEVLGRIFDPFFTTKEIGKGTGLGLATVHGIVQQHLGWIEVASQVGQGSTFEVFLPVWEGKVPVTATDSSAGAAPQNGSGEAVLIVEDEPTVREAARLALERGGYRVFEAGDGPEALAVWERCPVRVDLLVTDMVMPHGVSGGALARVLQSRDPHLQALYTSGYSSEVVREDLRLTHGANFLRKPYDTPALLSAVRVCLKHGDGQAAGSPALSGGSETERNVPTLSPGLNHA